MPRAVGAGASQLGRLRHHGTVTPRRLAIAVAALVLAVGVLVVIAWNLTDTREPVPPIELQMGR
jgi:hypothetical protein